MSRKSAVIDRPKPARIEPLGKVFIPPQSQNAPAPLPPVAVPPVEYVGLMVQFTTHDGETVPAMLQRRAMDGSWDVKVSLSGAAVWVTRAAVLYSATPHPGRWNLPPTTQTKHPQPQAEQP